VNSEQDQFIKARPRQVDTGPAPAESRHPPRAMTAWLGGSGLVLLLAIGIWIFVFLPDQIERPVVAPPVPTTTTAPAAASKGNEKPEPPPYEALQVERERQRAQATLARFVQLQIELDEHMHVAQWDNDAFKAALEFANRGDDLFSKQHYDEAMASYQQGIEALETLRTDGKARFEAALTAALQAIDARDAAAAAKGYQDAALVYPDDPRIAAGLTRVQRLPQIIELFDTADGAVDRKDWRAALATYREIQKLDPDTYGLKAVLDTAAARVADLDYNGLLSAGYTALDSGDFSAARRSFEAAARQRPNDAAARDGLNQAKQRATLTRIDALQQQAQRDADAENWTAALAAYEQVLAVDPTIKFAKDGRERAAQRQELDRKLAAAIADPGALSSDEVFAQTAQLYRDAVDIHDPGPRLTGQLDQLERILAIASTPVAVTLTSDSATQVTISQIGALGSFSRKEIQLRPGRYLLIGSRDGRRDVRRELEVKPQMEPIEISCSEAI
jgi:tetratricopeptide (TPR) repeat protein